MFFLITNTYFKAINNETINDKINELKEINSSRIFLIEYELIDNAERLNKLNLNEDLLDDYEVRF